MQAAHDMGKELHPKELAFTQDTYARLGLFINSFTEATQRYRTAYQQQSDSSQEYQDMVRKTRLYVSHFIQVVNMAILRGELSPKVRTFYGIEEEETRLPSLASDQDIVEWGRKIIDGEFNRTAQGSVPITNPSIALVKVQYEQFFDGYTRQKVFQQNTNRTLLQLNELRHTADAIILSIWNEVEESFSGLAPSQARDRCREYGVHYVYRKNELKDVEDTGESLLTPQMASLFQDFAREQEDGK
ncbi:MAG: hypothetical protein CSA07_04440 [Bacteroidia bacterium]|nr:MAG: hypothetical protein CSA07_04440 [Bacteroidia bacterium]